MQHVTSAWIVSCFVSFIHSEIVRQIVSTLFIVQLYLLVIICLAVKATEYHVGHYSSSFA